MAEFRYEGAERRKFKRLKKQFSLRLQIKGGGDFAEWDIVFIKDISRLGLSFIYNQSLKIGLFLNLKINFGVERGVIQCTGKVIRSQPVGTGKTFDIGVEFVNIGETDGELIDQLAVEFYAKQSLDKQKKPL